MEHSEFRIGGEFMTEGGRWRVTDIGTRTVVAIRIDPVEVARIENGSEARGILSHVEADREGWFNGPPYALAEIVFDEDDFEGCRPV